jgi:hypothetical protein
MSRYLVRQNCHNSYFVKQNIHFLVPLIPQSSFWSEDMAELRHAPMPTLPPTLAPRQLWSTKTAITMALTTIFTPPSDCVAPILHISGTSSDFFTWGSVSASTSLSNVLKSEPSCYPTSFYLSNGYVPLYSPGVCPSGYSIDAQQTLPDGAELRTYATCCPTSVYNTIG